MYAELKRKVCLQCEEEKDLDAFRCRLKQGKYVCYESYCKKCERVNYKKWAFENKDKLKSKDFERNCRKFGVSPEKYWEMHAKQDGKCAICGQPETCKRSGKLKNLAIDHCHSSNKVRDLLCNSCNTAIGLLKENPVTLQSAIQYLNKFKKSG